MHPYQINESSYAELMNFLLSFLFLLFYEYKC